MSNRFSLMLAATIVAAFALDLVMGWGGTIFLMRKMLELLDYVMFWR